MTTWRKTTFPFEKKERFQLAENSRSARCSPSVFSQVLAARKTNLITPRASKDKRTVRTFAKTIRYSSIKDTSLETPFKGDLWRLSTCIGRLKVERCFLSFKLARENGERRFRLEETGTRHGAVLTRRPPHECRAHVSSQSLLT